MQLRICRKALLAGAGLLFTAGGWAQKPSPAPDHMDVAVTYDALQANLVAGSRFWMNGADAQVGLKFAPGWSCIADVAGHRTDSMASTGIGLDLVTLTFGPQYALRTHHAVLFGQARFGLALGSNSLFPSGTNAPTSDAGPALALGGGIDLPVAHRLSLRLAQAEWDRTQLGNLSRDAQNSLRLSAGLVLHLR